LAGFATAAASVGLSVALTVALVVSTGSVVASAEAVASAVAVARSELAVGSLLVAGPELVAGAIADVDAGAAAGGATGGSESRGGPEVTRPSGDVGGAETRAVGTTVVAEAGLADQVVVDRGPVAQLGSGSSGDDGVAAVAGRGAVAVVLGDHGPAVAADGEAVAAGPAGASERETGEPTKPDGVGAELVGAGAGEAIGGRTAPA
jgi:hypothetical protein